MNSTLWSRWTTILAVLMLAVIAAVVSYSHMYELAQRHGEPAWRAALFPLSVDGMIVASSMALLADARHGRRGGLLPWTLLILGSVASLAANIAVADPTLWSRVIHAWPSFALMGAYELLMREFRIDARGARTAHAHDEQTVDTAEAARADPEVPAPSEGVDTPGATGDGRPRLHVVEATNEAASAVATETAVPSESVSRIQIEAWHWALDNRREDGSLPTGREIAAHFDHKDRWGRLIKQWGQQGRFDQAVV
ncbi:DUF2637 domain-containing protein [Streptomonospora litoralis]|uniref:DUF2637 domain-containing protein n=1 Tax=Streptomonospora litoralis TaxID=2498135 RepID=A0A4P6QAB9_9ACTN|nr:DUF2637 domain-containing protein [Streptomonospora litoralis]QBI56167.1 hypothetical protein EKD16_22070 [Streptomonospora litoralis]